MSDVNKVFDLRNNAANAYGKSYTTSENFANFINIVLKMGFLFIFLTVNFLGLSVALNCNANSNLSTKIGAALFGFFFGFIYLLLNYYTYRVLTLRKICIMDKKRLFPFSI